MGAEVRTQILIPAQQVLYQLSHPPIHSPFYLKKKIFSGSIKVISPSSKIYQSQLENQCFSEIIVLIGEKPRKEMLLSHLFINNTEKEQAKCPLAGD